MACSSCKNELQLPKLVELPDWPQDIPRQEQAPACLDLLADGR